MNSSPAIDNLIALRILHMLVTPFKDTQAYKLGIIDEKGNILKKAYQLHSPAERAAYTYLHRLVFRLKRIIEKVPLANKKFVSYVAAFALIREYYNAETEPEVSSFEGRFITDDVTYSSTDTELVEHFFSNKYVMPFKLFMEEMGTGALGGGAPANNVAVTSGIALPDPAPLGSKKVLKRKSNEIFKKSV